MKVCTRLRFAGEGPPEVVDVSLVDDDHEFGWVDGELHIEGTADASDTHGQGATDG